MIVLVNQYLLIQFGLYVDECYRCHCCSQRVIVWRLKLA